jgi:hypothetical protein
MLFGLKKQPVLSSIVFYIDVRNSAFTNKSFLFRTGSHMNLQKSFCLPAGKKRQLFLVTSLVCILMAIQVSVLLAAPAMLNNGQEIDIPKKQFQTIKHSPGIFFFSYRPEDIFKHEIRDWIIIKLSNELGGGFLAGTAENMAHALSAAGVFPGTTAATDLPQKPSSEKKQAKNRRSKVLEIEAGYGYRRDSLDWNIAGNLQGNNPNVLSELTWKDLLIHEFQLGIQLNLRESFLLKGSINYGVIVDGENQDSDFAADNREMEFSRSNNDSDQGSTLDGLFGAGYRFRLISESFSVIPLVGYSYHRQHLTMTDGYQTITWAGGPPLGPFEGLDSTYDAEWRGPWIGFDLTLETKIFSKTLPLISFYAGWEHHWAAYYAEADWNLRTDFMHPKSFEHEADGTGTVVNLGVCLRLNDRWSVTLGYETEEWSTEEGIDRVFLANNTIVTTRLNEVNWHSDVIQFGCSVRF